MLINSAIEINIRSGAAVSNPSGTNDDNQQGDIQRQSESRVFRRFVGRQQDEDRGGQHGGRK